MHSHMVQHHSGQLIQAVLLLRRVRDVSIGLPNLTQASPSCPSNAIYTLNYIVVQDLRCRRVLA